MYLKIIRITVLISFLFYTCLSNAQRVVTADLQTLIETAQSGSSAALLAQTRLDNQYWRNVSFKASFKPQFSLNATLPSLNRAISAIPLPDGSEAFVNRSFMTNSIGINVFQQIGATGGQVFAGSRIQRLDLFGTSSQEKSSTYLSTPLNIGLIQPLFQFNAYKWNKEIIDLEYSQAQKTYTEENEIIALEVVNRYFGLYITELDLITAHDNQLYLDSLAKISVHRFELGRIGETEMLQVQLSARNADTRVASLNQQLQNRTENLRDYLGIQEEVTFSLTNPGEFEKYFVDKDLALQYANAHRSQVIQFDIRLKEAQRDLEAAKKINSPQLNINAQFGLTNSAPTFGGAFSGLQDQESIQMGVSIPIADWGRSKAQREIAKSTLDLEQLQIKEGRIQFEREVVLGVEQLLLVRDRLQLEKIALEIATKRQEIAKKRYTLGKEDATNLNIAIQEYATAEQGYYSALWELWQAHYQLRLSTLFDFQENKPLKK